MLWRPRNRIFQKNPVSYRLVSCLVLYTKKTEVALRRRVSLALRKATRLPVCRYELSSSSSAAYECPAKIALTSAAVFAFLSELIRVSSSFSSP